MSTLVWRKALQITQQGSALIELIVAVLVVGLVLTALAMTMTYSIKLSSDARQRDVAVGIAQDVVEAFHKERALQGWTAFYTFFSGAPQFRCLHSENLSQLDQNLALPRDLSTLYPQVSSPITPSSVTCMRSVDSITTEFYTQVSVGDPTPLNEDITVVVDVLWDWNGVVFEKRLSSPVIKIFRSTE